MAFLQNAPRVTRNIIAINIIIFLACLINKEAMLTQFALFYPTSRYFHIWQVVTHMFMHGGVWHIFFNMYTLFIFGSVMENIIGEKKFLLFYFICGIGAALVHLGVEYIQVQSLMNGIAENSASAIQAYNSIKMTPTVGASGAIYGVLIGYAMLFPDSKLTLWFPPVTLSAKWMVVIFLVIELFTGITGTASGIAHFAHLGGMLFGYAMIKYWKKKGTLFERENF